MIIQKNLKGLDLPTDSDGSGMSEAFGAVNSVLKNPAVKAGLLALGPHTAIIIEGVQALASVFASTKRRRRASAVLALIDDRAAELIKDLATTKSERYRAEIEIRLHEILSIGIKWDRIK